MGFYIAQGGTSLQVLTTAGAIDQTLTLPGSVTLDSARRARFAILGQQILLVNTPSQNLWIDPSDFTVRPMGARPPASAPLLAAGSSTGLTGAYRVRVSFIVKDEAGRLLYESPLGPMSASVTLANTDLSVTQIPVSNDSHITGRRLYRTVAGGTVFFQALDIDDNVVTEVAMATADAALDLLPSDPELGNPPGTSLGTRLELLVTWRGRLWAKSAAFNEVDRILFCDLDKFYAWAASNYLLANPVGEDEHGITAFIPRRDELVVCKRARVLKVVGRDEDDFEVIGVVEGMGCVAPDSTVVIRDIGYFLGLDGVYRIGPDGVAPISDDVAPWFLEDTVFNRDEFPNAIGGYNPDTDTYDLHLASAGQTTLDRWVSYDVTRKQWTGPHLTGAFVPTARALLREDTGQGRPSMGSTAGHLWEMNQAGASDGGTAISIDWLTKEFVAQNPDYEKYWGAPTVHVRKQAHDAGDLAVTPFVGALDAGEGAESDPRVAPGLQPEPTQQVSMRHTETVLDRLGQGKAAQLQFTHTTDAEDVHLRGIELPYIEVGRRRRHP